MPMATEVGSIEGHRDDVADSGLDVTIATRAEVTLGGLIGLNAPHLHLDGRGEITFHHRTAHVTAAAQINNAATTIR